MSQLSVENYSHKTWGEKFPDGKVNLHDVYIHKSWKPIFKKIIDENPEDWKTLNDDLSEFLADGKEIFPRPDLVFNAFNQTPFDKIKVLILGQDAYYNDNEIGDKKIPEAMGLSFSVPIGVKIPSSLRNIYNNAVKFKEMYKYPAHGNLEFWAKQGCLLINTALTVVKKRPNIHAKIWNWFTDKIIEKISDDHNNLVCVFWGSPSLIMSSKVDSTRHHFIISSHPSGLSCNHNLKHYPAFVENDHFGQINNYLEKNGQKKIIWQIV